MKNNQKCLKGSLFVNCTCNCNFDIKPLPSFLTKKEEENFINEIFNNIESLQFL